MVLTVNYTLVRAGRQAAGTIWGFSIVSSVAENVLSLFEKPKSCKTSGPEVDKYESTAAIPSLRSFVSKNV